MKRRLSAAGILIFFVLSLCACSPAPSGNSRLNGKQTEYSETIAYANGAWGGVEITETDGEHTLKNQSTQLDFGQDVEGLQALTSLQTGETLLQNTVITQLTTAEGTVGQITGGSEIIQQGNYGVSHYRTDSAVRLPGNVNNATVLKEFDLTKEGTQSSFSVLKHDVSATGSDTGLKITSEGKNRSQFGARYLDIALGTADHFYLSVTLKAENISGLKCYFSTDTVTLTEDTLLGTLDLSAAAGSEFVTLTAEIKNELWNGSLQTLLFRLPEGETGSLEISRIALLTLNDPLDEGVASTLWTVYSDRIYFSQSLNFNDTSYTAASTVISVNAAKCREVVETENAVGLKMIDGSILGFVRPTAGATLRVERDEGAVRLILDWDLSAESISVAMRIYLSYTDDPAELETIATEERNPLTAEHFTIEGAEFERYDPRGGMYRLKRTDEKVTVTVAENERTVYLYLEPAEGTAWTICDKKEERLPIFAGTTFPLCSNGSDLTVQLTAEPSTESVEIPSFFADAGLLEQSRSATVLNGLCAQNTTVYLSPDNTYSVTLTTTKLKDGRGTIYDIQYDFLARKQVSDVRETFPFFSFELTYGFEEYFYLNGENQTITAPAGSEQIAYLGSMPYLGLSTDGEAAGWLVTNGQMTAGGIPSTALLCLRYAEVTEGEPNKMYLSFDQGETDFVRGDTLTAQVIRLEGDPIDKAALKTLRNGGNFQLIQTQNRSAGTFTALGMEETVIVQIEGFDDYRFPEITANGEPYTPEYHVYVDENGYYGFAFAVATGTELAIED